VGKKSAYQIRLIIPVIGLADAVAAKQVNSYLFSRRRYSIRIGLLNFAEAGSTVIANSLSPGAWNPEQKKFVVPRKLMLHN